MDKARERRYGEIRGISRGVLLCIWVGCLPELEEWYADLVRLIDTMLRGDTGGRRRWESRDIAVMGDMGRTGVRKQSCRTVLMVWVLM